MDTIKKMPTAELFFDKRNPRLVEFTEITPNTSEEEIVGILWEAMDVKELVLSMAASGYFEHEPLIVSQESGRNIVIEGNRRLAAVKVILNPELINVPLLPDIADIDLSTKSTLHELPVLTSTRKDAWRYLGFKHVNGPAKWRSYAKAQYIAQVHKEYKIPLEKIARQIGDTHKTVQRLYRGLKVVEQAEEEKVFSREDTKRNHFAFSHIYTGLDYRGISDFLSLKDLNEITTKFVPDNKLGELKELCQWLYGSKQSNIEPVVQSQNPHLRQLDDVIQNREALAALRADEPLDRALELTKPVANVFEEELLSAKRSLVKAKGLVTEGYDGSEALLKIVGSISNIADDLYTEMERKQSAGAKRKPRKKE